jgi:Flp pilus assembly protein TadD
MLEREVEEKLLEALDLYKAEQYEEALVAVEEVLELDPENGRAGSLKHTIEIQLKIREKFGEKSDDVESNEG